jgi:hypothetical protein
MNPIPFTLHKHQVKKSNQCLVLQEFQLDKVFRSEYSERHAPQNQLFLEKVHLVLSADNLLLCVISANGFV